LSDIASVRFGECLQSKKFLKPLIKSKKNDTTNRCNRESEFRMNESIIETEIINILTQTSPIRTTELVRKAREKHSGEMGCSNATIYRRIHQLKKQKKILEIRFSECKIYGINDPDKRAHYLILPEFDAQRQHIDEILKLLKNGDNSVVIAVFDELDRYTPRYPLNPSQLDKIVPVLKKDLDVVYRTVRILHSHLTRFRIAPIDKKSLLENIKGILEKIDSNYTENLNTEGYCLEILGMWNDPYVVEQLKKDARDLEKLKKVKPYYESPFVAKVIDKERTALFYFLLPLRKSQDDQIITNKNRSIVGIISDIQSRAANFVMYPPRDAELYTSFDLIE